jgi:hypothetical protein
VTARASALSSFAISWTVVADSRCQLARNNYCWLQRVGDLIKCGAQPSGIIGWHGGSLREALPSL